MKIAMLTNNYMPIVGGVPVSVERQAVEMAKLGHDVTVFAPEYDTERAGKEEMFSGDRGRLRIIRFAVWGKMENGMPVPRVVQKEILWTFQKEKFDLIHTHHPMLVGTTALYLGKRFDIPVVYTYHTRYEDYLHYLPPFREADGCTGLRKKIFSVGKEKVVPEYMQWFTNQCDMVFAPTAGMQKRIRENGTKAPMAVLPTGLKDEFYLERPEEAKAVREEYLPDGKGFLFCTSGRLEKEKNLEFILKGICKLRAKLDIPFQVLLIGDGSRREALTQEAKELGILDRVCFVGNVPNEELNRYLQACDIYLFASKSETQGIVLAEAMASGCPAVAVQASGVEDIVRDGSNGFVTEEDTDAWTEKILESMESRVLPKMKRQARITAEGFRASRLALYEEVLYRQCIMAKYIEMEDIGYGYQADGQEAASKTLPGIFKAS